MGTKILLGLLMLFGMFFQAFVSVSERNIDASSSRHVRQIIDTSHNRDERVFRQNVPYVVLLIKPQGDGQCTGIILGPRIILTAAHCVFRQKVFILTGGRIANTAKNLAVIEKHIHERFDIHAKKNDLALLVPSESIDLINSFHRPIKLYEGNLPQNSHGLVSGWGCPTKNSRSYTLQPLSILVPIITLQQCQHSYANSVNSAVISHQEICTYYVNRTKSCTLGDSGGPLVVSNHLVGVFSWFGDRREPALPDVFMNLMDSGYKMWVESWVNYYQSRYRNRGSP